MGGQQGDDLQLNGDLACENAEVRGELLVHGVPVTPGGSSKPQIVVYQPAIAASAAPIYKTWAEVETAINAVDGAAQLWIDQTGLGGFTQIPPTANLDGKGRLEIIGKGPQGEAEMVMQDGAQIKNVACWRTIVVRGNGNVRASIVYDIDGMIVETFDATFLYNAVVGSPVIQFGAISYISMFFSESSELRNSHNPGVAVIDMGATPGVLLLLTIDTLFYPSSFDNTIADGAAAQTLQIQTDASVPPIDMSLTFGGTFTQTYIEGLKLKNQDGSDVGPVLALDLVNLQATPGTLARATLAATSSPLNEFYYLEDFVNFSAVKDYSVGGSATLLDPTPVPSIVGALQLQSFASGDAVSVSCSDGVEFVDLQPGITTFIGRVQPPFGPPTAVADFSIHVGWVQAPGPIYPLVQFGTYFRAGFAENGNSNWWAVDTLTGGSADTGVAVNTGGPTQTLMIVYTPTVTAQFYINGVLVATLPLGGSSLIVGMGATWNDISRGGDAYIVDFLCTKKVLNRGV